MPHNGTTLWKGGGEKERAGEPSRSAIRWCQHAIVYFSQLPSGFTTSSSHLVVFLASNAVFRVPNIPVPILIASTPARTPSTPRTLGSLHYSKISLRQGGPNVCFQCGQPVYISNVIAVTKSVSPYRNLHSLNSQLPSRPRHNHNLLMDWPCSIARKLQAMMALASHHSNIHPIGEKPASMN